MKNRSFLLSALAALTLITSCDMNNDGTSPQYYSFVSVNQDKAGADKTSFTTDDNKHLVPKNLTNKLKIADGKRAMVFFYLNDSKTDEEINQLHEVDVILSQIDTNVVLAPSLKVADNDAAFALGNNGISLNLNPYYPQTTSKYFNFYVGVNAKELKAHKFYLTHAENAADTADELHLTLVHDDGNDTSFYEQWFWLSFPVDEFSHLFGDRKYAVVTLKTRTEGMQQVKLPLPAKSE